MDLDFTACKEMDREDVVLELMAVFNGTHHEITYQLDEDWRITQGGVSLTVHPTYRHEWNATGGFDVQVSFRETPTLDPAAYPQVEQSYFRDLPFQPVAVPCLALVEVLAEKVRAAYQRTKVRDLHDLFVFATRVWDRHLLRRLVVLKLWQVQDPFDPPVLFARLQQTKYNWEDLRRLLRTTDRLDPEEVIRRCVSCYAFLNALTEEERELAADARAHKKVNLWKELVRTCREKKKFGEFEA